MAGLPEIITSQSNIFFFSNFDYSFHNFQLQNLDGNWIRSQITEQVKLVLYKLDKKVPHLLLTCFIGWFLRREINLHRRFLPPAGDSRHRLVEAPRQIQLLFIFRRSKAKVLQIQKMITTIVGWLQKHKIYQINLDFLSTFSSPNSPKLVLQSRTIIHIQLWFRFLALYVHLINF